jgi:hypothetical protein
MKSTKPVFAFIMLAVFAAQIIVAAELQPGTLAEWNVYLKDADLHTQDRIAGGRPFLWMDESPERAAGVHRGEVAIGPGVGNGTESVLHGLVHDWIGTIFIPGASISDLWAVVHDYENYRRMYRPVVSSARTLACTDASQEFQMVWQRKVLFVSAAMQGDYQAHDIMLDAHRGYGIAESVEIREIEEYGHPGEHLLRAGTGNGFIWRIRSVARYEERDGGVYLELEAAALTRDIPASLAWMAKPVVNHLSVNSLTTTLRQTRDAIVSSQRSLETSASCPIPVRGSLIANAGRD